MSFAIIAGQDRMLQRCAEPHHTKPQVIRYASIVGVSTILWVSVIAKPNDNREEPRSTPRDLREQGPSINYNRMGHQPQVSHHQTRFNEGLNRQYSPNYINPYQSTLGSTPGQDLSATLIELANIQSGSMEMMAASQRSQQEAFQELT